VKAAFELAGEPRATLGRTDSRRLRKAGKVPAIMYGGGEAPEALVLDHNSLRNQMSKEAFYTSILTLKIGSKAQQVVVKGVERHPARPLIMHLDFQRVREDGADRLFNTGADELTAGVGEHRCELVAVVDRLSNLRSENDLLGARDNLDVVALHRSPAYAFHHACVGVGRIHAPLRQ